MTAAQQAFIDWLAPLARKYARPKPDDKLILPSLTIAQAIVESSWGRNPLVRGHNYFGIKANAEWDGPTQAKETREVYDGVSTRIPALFRAYGSIEEGFADHRAFLLRSPYPDLWDETDPRKACQAVHKYATEPTYPEILYEKILDYGLQMYDKEFTMTRPKIFLSPSSQESNRYAIGNTTEEVVCNKIASVVETILRNVGCDVRRNNPAETPYQHAMASNLWGADYHIPIHTNAGGGRGCEVFCYNPANKDAKSTKMAQALYTALSALTPTEDRGLRQNQTFTEIHRTTAACAYLEIDFHDSAAGAQWLLDNINRIGQTIANAILVEVGLKPVPTLDRPVLKSGTLGTAVRQLQEILNSFGYGLSVTGSFDRLTEACVVHWQVQKALTPDGIVGAQTWASFD